MKRTWNYLMKMLQSSFLRNINDEWSSKLYAMFETRAKAIRDNEHLRLCDQLEFTSSPIASDCAIFPHLHQQYLSLSGLVDECLANSSSEKWKPLTKWCTEQLLSDDARLRPNEIKAMLLLKIYYDYYCQADNENLHSIFEALVEEVDELELREEKERVFRAILEPEKYLIGYNDDADETNVLNGLFKKTFRSEDELYLRHALMNLMASIC
ncbi:unnamed protein product [Didymodactylos carnosus]|uniref:Uncharacterized protein n=1 Tax=Didymodactylos carnosus TaxID=1234261 RepID=A0A815JCV5_9BILA|nr:unnamed protein product [Didymodactylos carnosus]CAF4269802.1 unnamed protein product [Didymodactylos carnosus]